MACWLVISNGVQNVADNINNHDPKHSYTTSYQRQYSKSTPLAVAVAAAAVLAVKPTLEHMLFNRPSRPVMPSWLSLKHYKYLYAYKFEVNVWRKMTK